MTADEIVTVSHHVEWARQQLEKSNAFFGHGCENARDEAIWATLHVANLMDREFEDVLDDKLSSHSSSSLRELIRTRIETRQPLAYLLEQAWFAGRPFFVDQRAIVPRAHIGDLIQDGLEPWIEPDSLRLTLDLCTGSGCIAVALAFEYPEAVIHASDIDTKALEVARINVDRYGLSNQVKIIQSDLFCNLSEFEYDLIVCNPPYVDESEFNVLPQEYLHEPRHALISEEHGIGIVKKILAQSRQHLTAQGVLVVELGNSVSTLEQAFPSIPFLWLTSRSGESAVLLMTAEELQDYAPIFAG